MKVIGLDLSLRSTGVSSGRWADTVNPPSALRGPERHDYILRALGDHYGSADLVVAEGGAYSRNAQAGHEELTGLRQIVYYDLWKRGIPFAIVSPTARAKYGAGKGNASKDDVAREVQWRYGVFLTEHKDRRYDEADSLVLAAMGWHWLGCPLASPPDGFSLAGKWPEEAVAEVLRVRCAESFNPLNA